MNFVSFARVHGLLLDGLPPPGRWIRVPTEDHPRKKNGAAKWLGLVGWVQNHATMTEPAMWREDRAEQVNAAAVRRVADEAAKQVQEGREKAARRAQEAMTAARMGTHPYLAAKGFPELAGMVLDGDLIVPMRVGGQLVGVQRISADGGKKFLHGQRCGGATFVIGKGSPIYCEGYATGLSVHEALKLSRMAGSVVVCFSAHNLQTLATDGVVVADNDESGTGEKAAKSTGRPYWISDQVGEDFNDYSRRVGQFAASMAIKRLLMT